MAFADFNTGGIDDFSSGADIAPVGGADFQVALGNTAGGSDGIGLTTRTGVPSNNQFTFTGDNADDLRSAAGNVVLTLSPAQVVDVVSMAEGQAPGTDLTLNSVVSLGGDNGHIAIFDSQQRPDGIGRYDPQTIGAAVHIAEDGTLSPVDASFYGGSRDGGMTMRFNDAVSVNGTSQTGVQIDIARTSADSFGGNSVMEAQVYAGGTYYPLDASTVSYQH
ncbi:hypothetical protein [Futiania mangrovi]|uniref:Uncharacterized protein n=1 Tax=Futiania mangrovi TaxID=2959716 RepID=A0A9J6PI35_9PROT|nr:hypothetical protein [Futiania mangrovii]MCP1337467.1 hypothetical protein [Futiania mangrovii]